MHLMIRIVFMGSPDFAVPILRALAGGFGVAGVITQPDREAGRGRTIKPPAVKIAAEGLNIPISQPEKLRAPEAMNQLRAWAPDLIVVAAFGQILRPDVLQLPKHGCVNVHASLLPRWRGAAPIQAAIAAGDAESGVTLMKMDAGVDTGDILAQQRMPIEATDTEALLSEKLSRLGADILMETLPAYLSGELKGRPQDAEQATYAPMLKTENGELDFSEPAAALERRVRAFWPWPGTFMLWNGARLKVLQARVEPGGGTPGQRIRWRNQPAIATGDGLLVLEQVQMPGKKPMAGDVFLLGARGWDA